MLASIERRILRYCSESCLSVIELKLRLAGEIRYWDFKEFYVLLANLVDEDLLASTLKAAKTKPCRLILHYDTTAAGKELLRRQRQLDRRRLVRVVFDVLCSIAVVLGLFLLAQRFG